MSRKPSDLTVTDQFCGAGGSSIGAEIAGVRLVLGMNHWRKAIETHEANFPQADHARVDISSTDPARYPSTNILITSPECKAHTYARGRGRVSIQAALPGLGANDEQAAVRSRATMWDVPRFAEVHRYEIIVVENVVEARDWVLFDSWLHAMRALDYEWRPVCFNSMFAGVPQSRDRLYMVFWRRGVPAPDLDFPRRAWCPQCDDDTDAIQTWKADRTVGRYGARYVYRCVHCESSVLPPRPAVATVIDWTLPATRIGDRTQPLASATLERIQAGIDRYWRSLPDEPVDDFASLVIDTTYSDGRHKSRPVTDPLPTQTSRQAFGLVTPFIAELRGGGSTARPITDPLSTVTASGNHHMLVEPPPGLLVRNCSGQGGWSRPTTDVLGSLTTVDQHALLRPPDAFLASYYGVDTLRHISEPMGTLTTKDRHSLVSRPDTADVDIDDCTFRMLEPHEIKAGHGFPDTYRILGTKRDVVHQIGNAVTPPVMTMLMEPIAAALA
ncbi:MAG TPA: DNA cytosine methyltransferase [Candidatus Angelobacter sp.]|jgi:DNA (cytosine-5)-methyltransferase 1|nr:DNA cytosine methyltransferase [Candidatus Angelobacter sp.]